MYNQSSMGPVFIKVAFFYRLILMVNTIIRKILILLLVAGTTGITKLEAASAKAPVDYVNPYMGNISHLLVPTYPIYICPTVC